MVSLRLLIFGLQRMLAVASGSRLCDACFDYDTHIGGCRDDQGKNGPWLMVEQLPQDECQKCCDLLFDRCEAYGFNSGQNNRCYLRGLTLVAADASGNKMISNFTNSYVGDNGGGKPTQGDGRTEYNRLCFIRTPERPLFAVVYENYGCPSDYARLESMEQCQMAGNQLGLGLEVRQVSDTSDPIGCFAQGVEGSCSYTHLSWNPDGKVDGSRSKRSVLCQLVATVTTTSTITAITTTSTRKTWTTTELTTTTTVPPEVIQCSLVLNVSSVEQFAQDPDVKIVLRSAVAQLLEVNETWIRNLTITLIESRRLFLLSSSKGLSSDSDRRLNLEVTTKGGVDVYFEVVVPPDSGPGAVTATLIMDRFDKKSIEEASEVINQVLQSGLLGSTNYDVTIVVKKVSLVSDLPTTPAPAPSSEEPILKMIIIGAAAASVCIMTLTLSLCLCRKKSTKVDRDKNFPSINFSAEELLRPPRTISEECNASLCKVLSLMLDESSPDVIVLFRVGQRSEDAVGSGPGLFYAAATIRALSEHRVPCFCALPDGIGDDTSLKKFSSCKILVVVETRAIYSCAVCLKQIHDMLTCGRTVIRLRFDEHLPEEGDWWPGLVDSVWIEMRRKVQAELELGLVVPDPPEVVQSTFDCLSTFAVDTSRRLSCDTLGLNALSTCEEVQSQSHAGYVASEIDLRLIGSVDYKNETKKERAPLLSALRSRTLDLLTHSTHPRKPKRPPSHELGSGSNSEGDLSSKTIEKQEVSSKSEKKKTLRSKEKRVDSDRLIVGKALVSKDKRGEKISGRHGSKQSSRSKESSLKNVSSDRVNTNLSLPSPKFCGVTSSSTVVSSPSGTLDGANSGNVPSQTDSPSGCHRKHPIF